MVKLRRTLKRGMVGPDVRAMKRGLARAHRPKHKGGRTYLRFGGGLTPLFGPYARLALKRFQTDRRIRVDGIYGPTAHNRLEPFFDDYARTLMRKRPKPPKPRGGKVVDIASREVGCTESPWGSNSGTCVRKYQAATYLGGTGWPWCAAFVVWCWKTAYGSVPRATAGAWDLTDNGGVPVPVSQVQPGDAVSYNTGSGHVNICVRDRGSHIETIGGNEGNSVKRSMWPKSMVHSCARHPRAAGMRSSSPDAGTPDAQLVMVPTEYDPADYEQQVKEVPA